MKKILAFIFILSTFQSWAQIPPRDYHSYTPAKQRLKGFEKRKELIENSVVNEVKFRNVGPTVMSGRIVDIDANPADPSHFYAAYASGGLWYTESNGTHFEPLFDNEAVMTLGDIAVNWKDNIIWVGTGENNSSRSSYSGVGMYKSTDNGKTWQHIGLEETHHIGRIILHPTDPNTVWVAALGHLYSSNSERGIYKTTDGGKTWKHTLQKDTQTGAIDLIIDPTDPNILYTSMWERSRNSWDFQESGANSGIYKSTDGGETWSILTTKKSGFPTGHGVGRIGLAQYKKDGKDILYAILDNQDRREKKGKTKDEGLTKDELRVMSKADFLALEKKAVKGFLSKNRFPKKYSFDKVVEMVKSDEIKPIALVEYLEDANSQLFDTPVKGLEIYKSTNGGKTWKRTHKGYIDNVFNSYGYYFGQIRVSPHNSEKLYIMGVPILRSDDGGANWENINGDNVHVDHHALWLNPNRDKHIINGNDGGVNISYDDGKTWVKCNSPAVGQFYAVNYDMEKPYNVYGGFQDNGVWVGPSTYRAGTRWHSTGDYPYKGLLGGDGMQVAIDSRDNNTIYTGFQFGYYYRINKKTGARKYIRPQHELGERPLRFNWQSPIHLSKHNQDILYFGANKVFRSLNKGNDLQPISGDLTNGGKVGDVPFGTLSTIHESDLKFGLLYVGSDDGNVHVSKDGGNNWKNISQGLPEAYWVSRVQASMHDEATVYVTLNGYRSDDFGAYIYVSNDYGDNWKQLGTLLPIEPINVVREDPKNSNILYIGTDHGLYVSINKGVTFMAMTNNLPAVSVHDLVIHPRDNDLIVGTHGRSIYIANVEHLQQITDELLARELTVFKVKKANYRSSWGSIRNVYSKPYEPKRTIPFYSKNANKATIKVIYNDIVLKEIKVDAVQGLNYVDYDLTIDKNNSKYEKALSSDDKKIEVKKADNGKRYLKKGEYTIEISVNETKETTEFKVVK
ncbi:MAG: WD40/YVTN/BNR-like repeat-containing protein [Saprospiraceae bacterium]